MGEGVSLWCQAHCPAGDTHSPSSLSKSGVIVFSLQTGKLRQGGLAQDPMVMSGFGGL